MPTFNTPMLTNLGRDLLGRVNAGKDTVSYTKTVFSSMDNSNKSDDDIKKITDVTPAEITTIPTTNYQDDDTIEVRGIGNNKGQSNAIAINTYATYAKDSDGNEIPFAIAVSQTPDYMPADSGQAITNLTFSIMFTVQDTKNITFTDPHNEAPTYQDVKDVKDKLSGIQGTINDTLKPYDKRISDNRNDIDSLKGNVYSKQDTDNSIKTAMNQATQHSDTNHSDLSAKNNSLSTKVDALSSYTSDYNQPNLVDGTSDKTAIGGEGLWWLDIASIYLEKGKTYSISAVVDGTSSGAQFVINPYADTGNNGNDFIPAQTDSKFNLNGEFYNYIIFTPKSSATYYLSFSRVNDSKSDGAYYKDLQITNTKEPVPFNISQSNREINDRISKHVDDASSSKVTDNHDGSINVNGSNLAMGKWLAPCDLNDVQDFGSYMSLSSISKYKNAPDVYAFNIIENFTLILFPSPNGTIHQILIADNNAPYYRHLKYNGTKGSFIWSPWRQFASRRYVDKGDINLLNYFDRKIDDTNTNVDNKIEQKISDTKVFDNRADAVSYANASDNPTICFYVNGMLKNGSVDVKSVYGYGNSKPSFKTINVDNPSSDKIEFDNVFATVNNDNVLRLHGTIKVKDWVNANQPILSVNISYLGMNNITDSFLNYQTATIDTDENRENVVIYNQYTTNNQVFHLENIYADLDHSDNLPPKLPTGIHKIPDGADLNEGYSNQRYWGDSVMYYYDGKSKIYNAPTSHKFLLQSIISSGIKSQNIKDLITGKTSYRIADDNSWQYGTYDTINFPDIDTSKQY